MKSFATRWRLNRKLPGPFAWLWLGLLTRLAARGEAKMERPYCALDERGNVISSMAPYQRRLQRRLESWLESLSVTVAGVLVPVRTRLEQCARREQATRDELTQARAWVPVGQQPPGRTFTVMPLSVSVTLAVPLTFPFASNLEFPFPVTAVLVIGLVVIEVFVAERAGRARGALLFNEQKTPMALSRKEAGDALQRLIIYGAIELIIVIALAVGRSEQDGSLLLWIGIGCASAALGVFAGVLHERARPWRRVSKLESRLAKAADNVTEARDGYDLITRRVGGLVSGLIARTGEIDEQGTHAFAHRWRRRTKGAVVPAVPRVDLPDEQSTIERMLEPLRDISSVPDLGVDLRRGRQIRTDDEEPGGDSGTPVTPLRPRPGDEEAA